MTINLRTAEQVELDALRAEVTLLLSHCTEKQNAFFLKVYPGGANSLDRDKLHNAISLCSRTVRKNETGDMYGAQSLQQGNGQ